MSRDNEKALMRSVRLQISRRTAEITGHPLRGDAAEIKDWSGIEHQVRDLNGLEAIDIVLKIKSSGLSIFP